MTDEKALFVVKFIFSYIYFLVLSLAMGFAVLAAVSGALGNHLNQTWASISIAILVCSFGIMILTPKSHHQFDIVKLTLTGSMTGFLALYFVALLNDNFALTFLAVWSLISLYAKLLQKALHWV